jgi:hypothetical protein
VFSSLRGRNVQPATVGKWMAMPLVAALTLAAAHWCWARPAQQAGDQPEAKANKYAKAEDRDRPQSVPDFALERTLKMVPVPRDRRLYNYQMVDASLLPRDRKGIWVLDFSCKPVRIRTVPVPGKGLRQIHYLYFKVVNRTGKPRMFAPQFVMINEKEQRFEDQVIPEAVPLIQQREEPSIPVLGAVDLIGMLPPSTKPNVDDAVFGVACWDRWDPKADRFSIYVRGLSDGFVEVPPESGGKASAKYKTLKLNFIRRGDEHNLSEKEIQWADPPYEWVYW